MFVIVSSLLQETWLLINVLPAVLYHYLFVHLFKDKAFSTNVKFGTKISTAMYYANSVKGFLGAQLISDVPASVTSG